MQTSRNEVRKEGFAGDSFDKACQYFELGRAAGTGAQQAAAQG